jgi:hypothetical protein
MSSMNCGRGGQARVFRALAWFVFICCVSCVSPARTAEYEQKQGNASLRIEANRIADDRVEIRLSDEIHLTVSMEGDAGLEVQAPDALVTSPDWQVISVSAPQKAVLEGSRIRWQERFRLSPLKPGDLSVTVAPLRFRLNSAAERWEDVVWRPVPAHVRTEIYQADLSELRDVPPPEEVPPAPSLATAFIWAALAVVFLLVVSITWMLLRRRGWRKPPLTPAAWALAEMERIPFPAEFTEDGAEQFYRRLSDVLRRYLELRYHLPAPEQTTAEFLEEMRRAPQLQPEQQVVLRDFLERSDLVKFARAQPSLQECRTTAAVARAFVEQTTSNDYGKSGVGRTCHGT